MCVILSVAALLTSAAGCSRKSNKNEKVLKQIINNPDSYPQLSFAEFNTLINGKTGLSAAELPRDKACDTGDNGYDFTRYIVGGEFIFSCYINSKKPVQSTEHHQLFRLFDECFDDSKTGIVFLREIGQLGKGRLALFPLFHQVFAERCAGGHQKCHRDHGKAGQEMVHAPHFDHGKQA